MFLWLKNHGVGALYLVGLPLPGKADRVVHCSSGRPINYKALYDGPARINLRQLAKQDCGRFVVIGSLVRMNSAGRTL